MACGVNQDYLLERISNNYQGGYSGTSIVSEVPNSGGGDSSGGDTGTKRYAFTMSYLRLIFPLGGSR